MTLQNEINLDMVKSKVCTLLLYMYNCRHIIRTVEKNAQKLLLMSYGIWKLRIWILQSALLRALLLLTKIDQPLYTYVQICPGKSGTDISGLLDSIQSTQTKTNAKTNKQTNNQKINQTNKQTPQQTNKQTNKKQNNTKQDKNKTKQSKTKQTNKQIHEKKINKEVSKQTYKQTK